MRGKYEFAMSKPVMRRIQKLERALDKIVRLSNSENIDIEVSKELKKIVDEAQYDG